MTVLNVQLKSGVSARLDALPSRVGRLTFLSALMDDREMRRFFTGTQSQSVCAELGLPISKIEAENCRVIAAHWSG